VLVVKTHYSSVTLTPPHPSVHPLVQQSALKFSHSALHSGEVNSPSIANISESSSLFTYPL